MSELAKKQKEAMERMKKQKGGATKPQTNTPSPSQPAQAPKPRVSNEDRLAELRRKSELSRQNAKSKTKPGVKPRGSRKESSDKAMRVTEFCSKDERARTIIESMKPMLEQLPIPPIGTDFAVRWNNVELAIKGSGSSKQESPASKTHTNVFRPVPTVQSKAHQRGKSKPNKNRGRNRNTQKTKNKTKHKPKGNKNSSKRNQSKKNAKVVQRANIIVPKIQNHKPSMKTKSIQQIIDRLRQKYSRSKNFIDLESLWLRIRKLVAKNDPNNDREIKNLKDEFDALLRHFPTN
jgi:hypothetical protein